MKEWESLNTSIKLLEIGESDSLNTTIDHMLSTALNKYLTKITEISGTSLLNLRYGNASDEQYSQMLGAEQFIVYNSEHNYRIVIEKSILALVKSISQKIDKLEYLSTNMAFICPLCVLIIILAIIPSLIIVYRLATTILYQLCEIPIQYCKTLIEEANKFSEEMQLPMLKLAKIFTSIDFQTEKESNNISSIKPTYKQTPTGETPRVDKKEEEAESLLQKKIEEEIEAKKKVEEKHKLFSKYNGRKARIFIIKVVILLVPIFIYAVIDMVLLKNYFATMQFILRLNKVIYESDIYPVGSLFILRENLLLNETLADDNVDVLDEYLNKSFAIEQEVLEMRKEMDEMPNFRDFLNVMNSNESCKHVISRLSKYDINITEERCLNVSHCALEYGYNNAMMYFLRIIQDIKFRMEYTSHTKKFMDETYNSSDLIEAVDLYLNFIKMGSIEIFFMLLRNRENYHLKVVKEESIMLVVEIVLFIFVFLVIWINVINSLQFDVNTTKGVLNIFPTKYILPEKVFIGKIKSSFVFK